MKYSSFAPACAGPVCISETDIIEIDDATLDEASGAAAPLILFAAVSGLAYGVAAGYLSNR